MKILGIEGLSEQEVDTLVAQGAKFVMFEYCISVIFMTFKRSSDVFFVRPGENALLKGLPFTMISLLAGWWGFPWGPIYTIGSLITNFGGGKNVTSTFNS